MRRKGMEKRNGGRWLKVGVFGGVAVALLVAAGVIAYRLGVSNREKPSWDDADGVTVSILGDSISTFKGYIPTEDGVNLEHETYYPKRDVRRVEDTWWAQVIHRMEARLGVNESWSGSRVLNRMEGNEGNVGEDAAMASMTRIRNLGSNGTPEIILFFGGTNDITFHSPVGEFDPVYAPIEADLTATKWDTFAEAYAEAILRMQALYPEAEIYAIAPTENLTHFDNAERAPYVAVIQAICAHYGVTCIDLSAEGFSTEMLPDGTHPNREGMACIAEIVLAALGEGR